MVRGPVMIRLYRNYIGLIILLGVALLPKLLTGEQTYVIEHLNTRHGLSQNDVHAIHQDQYGFMWFGTAGGLNRFDGINYRLYKQNNDDTTTISDNRITIITEDSQGNLWIGTRNGLNRYDHTRDIFINPVFNDGTYYITDLFIDEKDDIWISTLGQGLYKYSIPSDSLTDFKLKKNEQGISETHITAIFKSREGHY